jgi:hypothetical protein
VTRALLLLAALQGCAAAEGTVLLVRVMDGSTDATGASPDTAAPIEDAASVVPDAAAPNQDAGVSNTRGVCRIGGSQDGFHEDFSGVALDPKRWLVAHGPVTFAGSSARGGFARDNVQLRDGSLRLLVRGDAYQGAVRSVDASGRPLASGQRSAAALVTRDLFASATYQIQGVLVGPAELEVAIWFVRDDDGEGAIDLTTPGRAGVERSYSFVHMRTRDASSSSETQFALGQGFEEGASHILRFDWYTTASPSVSFWVDDELRWKSRSALPPRAAGRLWIVAWVPDAAPADFDTAEIRIDNAFVTPFGNDGDACTDGALAGPSLGLPR